MNQLQALYYALLRRVPRWLIAVVLTVGGSAVFWGVIFAARWLELNAKELCIGAAIVAMIAILSAGVYSFLPTDPRKRKDDL